VRAGGSLRTAKAVFGAACLLYLGSLLTAFGVLGAPQAPTAGAGASGYEYQYSSGHVTGGGQILGNRVNFSLTADADTAGVRGTCNVLERNTVYVRCLTVTSLIVVGTHATITGTAVHNGVETTFTIEIDDLGEPGIGRDRFSITTGTGFSRSGVLTAGNIQIHQ
jgi:hypothetical protein